MNHALLYNSLLTFLSATMTFSAQAQTAQSVGSGPGRVALAPVPTSSSPFLQVNSMPGILNWAGGDPAFLGWTVDVDPAAGSFRYVKPLFAASYNDETGSGDYRLLIEMLTSSDYEFRATSFNANVAYSAGLVSVSAMYAQSNEVQNEVFGHSLVLAFEANYPDSLVNLPNVSISSLHPDAQVVLAISDPAERAAAWKAAGFGPYIAFGYGLRGRAGLTLNCNSLETYEGRSTLLSLKARYAGVSGQASLAEQTSHAFDYSTVSLDLFAEGLDTPPTWQIPTAALLADEEDRAAWEQSVLDSVYQSKKRHGLWLAPVSVLPNGPNMSLAIWDGVLLNSAAIAAQDAIWTLSAASGYNRPYALRYFLDARPIPETTTTYGAALDEARVGVTTALVALSNAIKSYLTDDHSSIASFQQAVSQAISTLDAKQEALDEVLMLLDAMVDSLPQVTISPLHVQDYGGTYWSQVQMEFAIDNIAMFSPSADIDDWMRESFSLLEHTTVQGPQVIETHTFGDGELGSAAVDANSPSLNPGAEGLRTLRLRMMGMVWTANRHFYLTFRDQLGRPVTAHWDLDVY